MQKRTRRSDLFFILSLTFFLQSIILKLENQMKGVIT